MGIAHGAVDHFAAGLVGRNDDGQRNDTGKFGHHYCDRPSRVAVVELPVGEVSEVVLLDEGHHFLLVKRGDVEIHQNEIDFGVGLRPGGDAGELFDAGTTPGGPKIYDTRPFRRLGETLGHAGCGNQLDNVDGHQVRWGGRWRLDGW